MIVLNNNEFEIDEINYFFGKYNAVINKERKEGYSLFVDFMHKNFKLRIETIYDKENLLLMKKYNKEEITRFVTDITYEDKYGWISLITGKRICFIEKVEDDKYIINLKCITEECGKKYDIELNELIILESEIK